MQKPKPTQAQLAQTPLQEELAANGETVRIIDSLVEDVRLYHALTYREAICALRDYFQWKLAAEQDKAFADTQARIAELEKELGDAREI